MFPQHLGEKLEYLREEGERLLQQRKGVGGNLFALGVWFSSVGDTLRHILPKESALLTKFDGISPPEDVYDSEDKDASEQEIEGIVRATNTIIDYARLELVPTPKGKSFEEFMKEREYYIKGIELDVSNRVSQEYFKSWWFRIPIIILGLTIAFAILGVIQINNYRISVQEIADKAVERAKQDINAEVDIIRRDLEEYAGGEKEKISSDVDKYLEELEQQKAEATQALNEMTTKLTDLNPKVTSLEKRQDTLENRIMPLKQAFEVIEQGTTRGLWFDAVAILNNSLIVVGVTFLVSCIALIFSLVSFWRFRRR
jgi:hypothetical protein